MQRYGWVIVGAAVRGACVLLVVSLPANAQHRSLGLDVSAWQGNISQSTWNNIRNVDDRDFVFIRSSRGGTTGFYNQSDPNNNNNQNTLSQRYDDPYFVQNITRATNSGMLAGPYHFSRPDVIASTQNAGGIANSGQDEADHFIQMAGAWMRPGYLLPVHDLETGDGIRSDNDMAQFAIDFSDRVFDVMGIRPAIYLNGNYANFVIGGASASLRNQVVEAYPRLWSARWPNQGNPDAIPVQTGHPKDSFAPIYGPWDDSPNPTHPWSFWQYASTGRLNSFNNGNSNLDFNVAQGGIEFLKDQLVPAIWLSDSDSQWTTLENWNSGLPPIAPIQGPGQVARVGPLTLPSVRLPGADDTVILDRPNATSTVTLSSGIQTIRKLEAREALNISGGSLSINYIPSVDSTPLSARFSAPVSVTGTGRLIVHTLQVDSTQSLTLGGTLTFDTIQLMPHSTAPATIDIVGDVTFGPLNDGSATIVNGVGNGNSGRIDLGGASRNWLVEDGAAAIDLSIDVPIVNGTLFKKGSGTMRLLGTSAYDGDIIVQQGGLVIGDAFISDTANVFLSSGVDFELDFLGQDVVNSFVVNGVALPTGSWGGPGTGADFTASFLTGTGTVQVTTFNPILQGDYNNNGIVDAGDFTVWRDDLGLTGLSPFSGADGTGDGAVTSADFDLWQNNFGRTLSDVSGGQLVPEPNTLLVCWIGIASLTLARKRRR